MSRLIAGIVIGVVGSFVAAFIITLPFSLVWAMAIIGKLQGLPCGGFC